MDDRIATEARRLYEHKNMSVREVAGALGIPYMRTWRMLVQHRDDLPPPGLAGLALDHAVLAIVESLALLALPLRLVRPPLVGLAHQVGDLSLERLVDRREVALRERLDRLLVASQVVLREPERPSLAQSVAPDVPHGDPRLLGELLRRLRELPAAVV